MVYNKVLYLGDSLLNGARNNVRSVPFEVQKLFYQQVVHIPICDCVNGRTSCDLLKVVGNYQDPEIREVVLIIGTNDARDQITGIEYMQNIELIRMIMEAYHKHVYHFTVPVPKGFGSSGYSTNVLEYIKEYNKRIRLIGFYEESPDFCEYDFVDGIHFSNIGTEKMAKAIYQAILKRRTF